MCVCVCTLNDKREIKHKQSAPVLYYISRCIVSLCVCGKRDMCNMSGAAAVGILLFSIDIYFYFCIRSFDILLYLIDGILFISKTMIVQFFFLLIYVLFLLFRNSFFHLFLFSFFFLVLRVALLLYRKLCGDGPLLPERPVNRLYCLSLSLSFFFKYKYI